MTPSGLHHAAHDEAIMMVGLVLTHVNDIRLAVHIPNVVRVYDSMMAVHYPRPRPALLSMARIDEGLIPLIDLSVAFGLGPTHAKNFFVLVQDKEIVFAFPVERVESVVQLRADRIRYPRPGEVRLDRDFLRGYWRANNQRNGYILNPATVYRRIIGEPRKIQPLSSELTA
jgi:chemotaxis signal transduction protein